MSRPNAQDLTAKTRIVITGSDAENFYGIWEPQSIAMALEGGIGC